VVTVHKPSHLRSSHLALLLLALTALLVSACSSSGTGTKTVTKTAGAPGSASSSSAASSSSSAPSTTAKPTPAAKPVHVQGYPDGSEVGVGMPIIATFNKKVTDGRGFAKGTTVTVNGKVVHGAWFFEPSARSSGHVMEAHYRLQNYWPAHSHVVMTLKLKGVSAGKGLAFDGKLSSLQFTTGPRTISVVNNVSHKITVTSDGKLWRTFPVSLGASNTPTARGTKVIMEKGVSICMSGPGYNECGIKYTQRLTYGGEYLHSAPWNLGNIARGVNSSNGCTNMRPADAEAAYRFMRIGDVVQYPNADGPAMTLGAGYGDWNVDWGSWQTGGAVSTQA
jgi:lipoprotein-anchoring transpeptidase ErfK/SrfK